MGGNAAVKAAIAIIKPHELDALRDALLSLGVSGLTVTEVKRIGPEKGFDYTYRGAPNTVPAVPKLQVEVALGDAPLAQVLDIIAGGAEVGVPNQGTVFVQELVGAVRIRTGDTHQRALE
jgi:nitrogen regulatory protein PII